MKSKVIRIAAALVAAFLLPFPGPHVDRYLPLVAVILHGDISTADAGFYLILAAAFLGYAGAVFLLLSLLQRLLSAH